MTYYIDTNIFLYTANPRDPHYSACKNILKLAGQEKISSVTSVLTFEEIIFYSQKSDSIENGINICNFILKNPIGIISLTQTIIFKFLQLAKKYPKIRSADLIHTSTCLLNNIDSVISVDRDFDKISEIKRIDPSDLTFFPG